MKVRFILSLSEAQWDLYPKQANDVDSVAEFDLECGEQWFQFTYESLRSDDGMALDLQMVDGIWHHDGRVFSDVVVNIVPPTVVCIRDPDADNDYSVFGGDVSIHDVDLGRADLNDLDEFFGWAGSHLGSARHMPDEAATIINEIVMNTYERNNNEEWPQVETVDELYDAIPDFYKG